MENLPGIEFLVKEPKTDEEQEQIQLEREASYEELIFRVWSTNGSIETYDGISYEDHVGISLDTGFADWIGFIDGDGERVMLNLDYIAAFEIFDPFFIPAEELDKLMDESEDSGTEAILPPE